MKDLINWCDSTVLIERDLLQEKLSQATDLSGADKLLVVDHLLKTRSLPDVPVEFRWADDAEGKTSRNPLGVVGDCDLNCFDVDNEQPWLNIHRRLEGVVSVGGSNVLVYRDDRWHRRVYGAGLMVRRKLMRQVLDLCRDRALDMLAPDEVFDFLTAQHKSGEQARREMMRLTALRASADVYDVSSSVAEIRDALLLRDRKMRGHRVAECHHIFDVMKVALLGATESSLKEGLAYLVNALADANKLWLGGSKAADGQDLMHQCDLVGRSLGSQIMDDGGPALRVYG